MSGYKIKTLVFVFIISVITGCGFWTNFKTYFNTYYNANKIFVETEAKLLQNREELFQYELKTTPNNLSKQFEIVIEKTSSILQYSKESSYFEEALLMTGKSFYYQQNYSRALRKFNELASIKETDLYLENELWIANTYLQLRDFDKALRMLDEVKADATQDEDDEILIEFYKSKIGYLIYKEDYKLAIEEINNFLQADIDDELRAEVLYEMGRLYELIEDYKSAEATFAKVEDYSPTFEIEFSSKFEVAKLKGSLGEVDKSLELLKNLKDEDKFSDSWGDIELEIGKIYYDRKEIENAFDKFTEIDTTYLKTKAASIAGFYRAEILENYYHDYDSALVFYKIASTSIAPPSLRSSAKKKSKLLNQYISLHYRLGELETQRIYLTDPEVFRSDSLDYVERFRSDSIKFAEQNLTSTNQRGRIRQFVPKYRKPIMPKISIDSVHVLNSKYYFDLANLLFSEFDDPDSAFYYYNQSLIEDEENPNEAQTYYALGNYYLIKKDKNKADSMFTIVYDKFKFDPIRNEAAKQIGKPLYDFNKDPVEDEYTVAEEIYDSLKYIEAIDTLFNIYKQHPKSIYASKSLYTIGFILENNLDMPDSAASIYNILSTKYKTSKYSRAVQIKLSGYRQEQARKKAKQDSIAKANEARLDSIKKASEIIKEQSAKDDSVNSSKKINSNLLKETDDIKLDSNKINDTLENEKLLKQKFNNIKNKPKIIDTSKTQSSRNSSTKKNAPINDKIISDTNKVKINK